MPTISDEEYEELQRKAKAADNKKPSKLWLVVKLVDYKVQALGLDPQGDDDDSLGFMSLCHRTKVFTDREEAFQAARTYNGLLCSAMGVPSPSDAEAFAKVLAKVKPIALPSSEHKANGFDAIGEQQPEQDPIPF